MGKGTKIIENMNNVMGISNLEFRDEIGGNNFYSYKGTGIMETEAITDERFATPALFWISDEKWEWDNQEGYVTIEEAINWINNNK
tara:strand:- start:240 stop:497 length:258 start_codon:yes stop_codon:yes gene_type:complete